MTREEYIRYLKQEDYVKICHVYYISHDKKELTLDYGDFFKYFKLFLHRFPNHESIINKVTDYFNSIFKVNKVLNKEGELIGYY